MRNKKILLAILSIALVAIIFLVLEKTHVINLIKIGPKPSTAGPTAEQIKQENEANSEAKQQFIEQATDARPPSGDNTTTNKTIELTAKQESNNTLTVFTKLKGYNNGSCELTTTNESRSKTYTANVAYQPEFSSCAGFNVPVDPLGKGIWSVKLTVITGETRENKQISYEVK